MSILASNHNDGDRLLWQTQQEKWEFIKYVVQPEAQKIGATTASWTMNLLSIYDDPEVLRKVPLFRQFKPILQSAVPRPITANYADISTAIGMYVRQALAGQKSVSDTLKALATKLEQLIGLSG